MDQAQLFRIQQEQYNKAMNQAAQMLDLKTKYLDKRVKAVEAGMLTRSHRKQYADQTGIVVNILVGPVCGLEIAWEDGSTSQSLPYMVTLED